MNTFVYDKTDKGREEIATRHFQLASKLRTLLVMIDGRSALEALLKNCAGLGLTEASAQTLLDDGFIVRVSAPEAAPDPAPAARPPALSAKARMEARIARARLAAPQAGDGAGA